MINAAFPNYIIEQRELNRRAAKENAENAGAVLMDIGLASKERSDRKEFNKTADGANEQLRMAEAAGALPEGTAAANAVKKRDGNWKTDLDNMFLGATGRRIALELKSANAKIKGEELANAAAQNAIDDSIPFGAFVSQVKQGQNPEMPVFKNPNTALKAAALQVSEQAKTRMQIGAVELGKILNESEDVSHPDTQKQIAALYVKFPELASSPLAKTVGQRVSAAQKAREGIDRLNASELKGLPQEGRAAVESLPSEDNGRLSWQQRMEAQQQLNAMGEKVKQSKADAEASKLAGQKELIKARAEAGANTRGYSPSQEARLLKEAKEYEAKGDTESAEILRNRARKLSATTDPAKKSLVRRKESELGKVETQLLKTNAGDTKTELLKRKRNLEEELAKLTGATADETPKPKTTSAVRKYNPKTGKFE